MRNVGAGGESSLLPLYNLPSLLLQPPTSQITPGVDACQLAPGFASKPLSTSILLDRFPWPQLNCFYFPIPLSILIPPLSCHLHPQHPSIQPQTPPVIQSDPQLNWLRAPPFSLEALSH